MLFRISILIGVWIVFGFAQTGIKQDSINHEIRLRTFLEKDAVPLNEEVVYNVELSWIGEVGRYQILKISEPALTNLKLRGSGSANRFYRDQNNRPHAIKTITFYLTPLEMGMSYIDGITIQYKDTKTNEIGRLIAQRIGVEIVEPVERPGQGMQLGKLIVFALIAAFMALVLYSLKRYFDQKRRQQVESEPAKTLEDQFLEELYEQIQTSNKLPEHKFNRLVDLLKRYLKQRFELPPVSAFFEIRLILEKNAVNAETIKKLEHLFERAELVKFAAEPVNESELHFFVDTVELLLSEMNKRK